MHSRLFCTKSTQNLNHGQPCTNPNINTNPTHRNTLNAPKPITTPSQTQPIECRSRPGRADLPLAAAVIAEVLRKLPYPHVRMPPARDHPLASALEDAELSLTAPCTRLGPGCGPGLIASFARSVRKYLPDWRGTRHYCAS
eukprot:1631302-Rhodomonas_salina.1